MAKLEQKARKGLYGGFKPGSTGGPGTGKVKNTIKRKTADLKRAIGDVVSNVKDGVETRKNEKATEELAAMGSSKNPRFLQDALNPAQNAAMTAGGSRPMTAMNNPQVDPITGMPIIPGGQPSMNPNFIGGMANSNLPTTAMLAQESIENKMREEKYREELINTHEGKRINEALGVNYTPNPNPAKNYNKGFEPFGSLSGQAKSISSRKINGATVLGGNQPTKQSGLGAVIPDQFKAKTPQEKAQTIPAQNPGVYKNYDLSKPQPNEFDVKTSSGTRLGSGGDSEVAWRSYANDVASDHTTSGKGISGKGFSSLMHLERHGQTSRMNSGPLKSPTEKINDGFKKGYDTYLEKPKTPQDKKMPTGGAGKGVRSLPSNVQEKMGYDPLSQERLTQSRRSTKCMRVKKK